MGLLDGEIDYDYGLAAVARIHQTFGADYLPVSIAYETITKYGGDGTARINVTVGSYSVRAYLDPESYRPTGVDVGYSLSPKGKIANSLADRTVIKDHLPGVAGVLPGVAKVENVSIFAGLYWDASGFGVKVSGTVAGNFSADMYKPVADPLGGRVGISLSVQTELIDGSTFKAAAAATVSAYEWLVEYFDSPLGYEPLPPKPPSTGYTEFVEIQAAKLGITVSEYLDPRGYGSNWGHNAPDYDPNHHQPINVNGQKAYFESDNTRLDDDNSDLTESRVNADRSVTALLHKSADGRSAPLPGQIYPAAFVTGMPSAVYPFRTATRTWNSAT